MASNWVLLGTATTGGATVLSVDFAAKPRKRFLKYILEVRDADTGASNEMCYNTDTRTNNSKYSWVDWASFSTNYSSGTGVSFHRIGGDMYSDSFFTGWILNIENKEKLSITRSAKAASGDSVAVQSSRGMGTWNDNAQITKLNWSAEGQTIASGSKITVWGADDQPTTPVYPNLTNGTIFEESDTGKHYMFDGTSTWNEIT